MLERDNERLTARAEEQARQLVEQAARLEERDREADALRQRMGELEAAHAAESARRQQAEAEAILADLRDAVYTVHKVEEKEQRRQPPLPYTTSTLQ